METRHTPGPWTVHNTLGRSLDICWRVPDGPICHMRWSDGLRPVVEERIAADARLIARAPDLLAENDRLRAVNAELATAVKAMQAACDEWAAEFTQKKRAMDWGVVNDAYVKASAALARATGE